MSRILQARSPAAAVNRDPSERDTVRRPGATTAEFRVFTIALGLGVLHAVDDAVVNRQPGVPVGQHLPALAVTVAVSVAAVLWFRRARPGIRAGLALTLGSLVLTNGAMHVIHVVVDGVGGSDLTGVAAAAAGAVLVGLGAALPFLCRGQGADTAARRWVNRGIAGVAALVLVPAVVMPVAVAIGQTHLYRTPIGSPPSDAYRTVTFESSDGLDLAGWYSPSRNGAAVVVVASAGGDRTRTTAHAELLASHGYGVLLYDARGTGDSEGSPNGLGWEWDHDVTGAIAFLQDQPDVDPDRIGGLGLSTGADVLIEVAATDRDLRAVVADGATGRSLDDLPAGSTIELPVFWTMYNAVWLLSGTAPGPPLKELVADVAPTPLLLIAAGSIPREREFNAVYAEAASEPVELWDLPDVTHTLAIREVADEYEQRVIAHFDQALLDPATSR
jgi:uncharacterized protein